jgi:polyisoprenoid-binding protein YceI
MHTYSSSSPADTHASPVHTAGLACPGAGSAARQASRGRIRPPCKMSIVPGYRTSECPTHRSLPSAPLASIPLVLLLLSLNILSASAQKTEYHVDKQADNLVKFISDAPVENFEGVTDHIDGYLVYQGDDPTAGSELYFEVDLRTLDTGIGLRNRQMREDYLHTDRFPYAAYKGRIIRATPSEEGMNVEVRGTMDIHGVKRPMRISGVISGQGETRRIRSRFEVTLGDHDIEIPQFMFLKIDEVMQLVLDFSLRLINNQE